MVMHSSPTLVLGIGGTGLKAATFVLKGVMEANNNAIPNGFALLVADTEGEVKFKAGGWGESRGRHHATGPVSIGKGDYIPLTGNVKQLGEEISKEQVAVAADPSLRRRQSRRHINAWFQANHYLKEAVVDDSVWNLDVGAGQYPQFGRLSFFNHVNGRIKTLLESAIRSIMNSGADKFQVHIVGSFSGGTGAGLYIDFPHLIRKIAKQTGFSQSPTLIGHFVLAEGFRGTKKVNLANEGTKRAFDARTCASLRQLTRLQGKSLPKADGYPIVYDPNGVGMLNSKMDKPPYTYSYLYDGRRGRNSLNNLEIEDGLAPSIADVVLAYVDGLSGPAFQSHTVNYKAYYGANNIPDGQVTYGSVGTYTIELPIYHITEGWSHRLAKDVMDIVLQPQPNETGGIGLATTQPGGKEHDPKQFAQKWVLEEGQVTSLLGRVVRWGTQVRTSAEKSNTIDELLGYDAETWLKDLAPTIADFSHLVAEAEDDLRGSLKDKASRYFVDHDQGGNSSEARARNLVETVETQMKAMVGKTEGVWLRTGGNFYASLVRLANHHRIVFEKGMVKQLSSILNGEGGTAVERKQGKVGFARVWLQALEDAMHAADAILAEAEQTAAKGRRDLFTTLDSDLGELQKAMQHSSGVGGRKLKAYRNKVDELAQFHKADIARRVIHDLVKRLVRSLQELGSELDHWIGSLGTTTSTYGGTYSLLLDGLRDIEQDRQRSKNAVRWVIDDIDKSEISPGQFSEEPNTYIEGKRHQYLANSMDNLLNMVGWRVERTNEGEFRVQFTTFGQDWDRRAGRRGEQSIGQQNLTYLLDPCRAVFEPAWEDMSVTEYLYHNFVGKETDLAQRVYDNSGYLLQLAGGLNEPKMRTTYMRVFKGNLDTDHTRFLDKMLAQIRVNFNDSTSADERAAAIRADEGDFAQSLLNADGQDSYDRFKLTYIMFGDLLEPHQVAGYADAQQHYRDFSNDGKKWKELHILPAETNALAIERGMDFGQQGGASEQRRRELNEEVVAVLEDMDRFQLAMRCLAYGEEEFAWNTNDRGLLLHRHTPRQNNPAGNSYWRLTVMPPGEVVGGQTARPSHYQLSDQNAVPDLWEAILQLVTVGRSKDKNNEIDFKRVETTIAEVQKIHQSRLQQAGLLTWQPEDRYRYDSHFHEEGLDKASQVIRLNSLIDWLDSKLLNGEKGTKGTIPWNWVWERLPGGSGVPVPEGMDGDTQKQVVRDVDLFTALRWAAEDERERLAQRLYNLGQWPGNLEPREEIALSDRPAVAESWICVNGHVMPMNQNFCTSCGVAKPSTEVDEVTDSELDFPDAEPVLIPHPDPQISPGNGESETEVQKKLDMLKQARDEGAITQEQYETQVQTLSRPAVDPALQNKLDLLKEALDSGVITQEQYETQVQALSGSALDSALQKKLDLLKKALDEGVITQEQYETQSAQLLKAR